MRIKREGKKEEVWWSWEKRVKIADRQFKKKKIKLFAKKSLQIKLFARKFKHIYCKYLHGE